MYCLVASFHHSSYRHGTFPVLGRYVRMDEYKCCVLFEEKKRKKTCQNNWFDTLFEASII
jgi:hypothetical protein